MRNTVALFVTFLVLIVLNGCRLVGINPKHKTPFKPHKFPTFTRQDSLIGGLNPYRSCYDVYYYDLKVSFDLEERTIEGSNTIYFEAQEDFKTLQIDLTDNFEFAIIDDRIKQVKRDGRAILVTFKDSVTKGTLDSFTVNYSGKPAKAKRPPWDGGFVWKKDKQGMHNVGVACELIGASIWWPLKDHLSDEPDSMRSTFTVPDDYFCASNGVLAGSNTDNGKTSYTWNVSYPINSYNLTFYIGDYQSFDLRYQKDKPCKFYVLPEHLDTAQTHFKQSLEILEFFESVFGEYPFWRDQYKLIESPYEGMEHQTAIAYGDRYKNSMGFSHDYIILHETAHEWWGNSLSVSDYADIWLHEGFATYAEALYVEHKYGYSKYLDYLDFYAMLIKNKKSVVGPRGVSYWDYKDSDPYLKGANTLHTFRNQLDDDDLFFEIIKSFYQKNAYNIVDTEDWINHVNDKTQKDYTWFFEQYLFEREVPKLLLVKVVEDGNPYIYYKWENMKDFPLQITYSDGMNRLRLSPTHMSQKIAQSNFVSWVNPRKSYIEIKWLDSKEKFDKLGFEE